ncbi:3'-5' exonuclease [Paenibacillus sp. 481]|uniref:3'-5' exonuclease n=1 Tax=Paenibacillus sp. 481 TaxID=2835869 RepID=UPI001E5A3395|nr:3'-5' exonuclease [Paenibacillus sp. 481]UHA73634.1 3'-5' exonuclease [Paenibacillus sp. 481]
MKITVYENEYVVEGVVVSDLQQRTFCIFDFEGTGIDFRTECITQIGALRVEGEEPNHSQISFNSLVKSPKRIPPQIEELTGITNDAMTDAPSFPDVYRQFAEFVDGTVLITQAGYEYDIPMLEKYCEQHQLPMLTNPVIDTKALFTNIHPEVTDVVSADFLVQYYQIETAHLKRHDALDDCILIGHILKHILDEYTEKGLTTFDTAAGLKVKRFIMPSMYLENSPTTE